MPATDITNKCCPDYYKATRCDASCFDTGVAYIAATVFAGQAVDKVFVQAQTDDCDPNGTSGDKLCWQVDRNTAYNGAPAGANILTGVSGSDLFTTADAILDQSGTQDDNLWVVVCLCNKNEYFQMLSGGTSDVLVDTANNLQALKNKYNCTGDNHDDQCSRQQYFAFNVIGATIDGSTNNATNPLSVGDYITLSGSLVDVGGTASAVYGTPSSSTANDANAQLVGGGSNDRLKSATLAEDIFRVVDRTKQIQPDCATDLTAYEARLQYPYEVDAFVNSPIVKTHATGGTSAGSAYAYLENCQDCLQAYLGLMAGDSARATKTLNDVIAIGDATYNDTLSTCPSTWPCSVQISRTFSVDCSIGQNLSSTNNHARPLVSGIDLIPSGGTILCNDGDNQTGILENSGFGFAKEASASLEGHYVTDNIINADRKIISTSSATVNGTTAVTTVTITAEYKRNLKISQLSTRSTSCPDATNIDSTNGFDYSLNSVSVTSDADPNLGTLVLSILNSSENPLDAGISNPPLLPAYENAQGKQCGNDSGGMGDGGEQGTDLIVDQRFKNNPTLSIVPAPAIGYDAASNTYKGRLFIQRNNGTITPFYKYVGYYSNHLADQTNGAGFPDDYTCPEDDATRFTAAERQIFAGDGGLVGKKIDEVIPFAPYLQLAAGFNVNGFNHTKQLTAVVGLGGRDDAVTVGSDRLYPGKSNTSKITFGSSGVSGTSITGLPFYFDSYCTAISSMETCNLQQVRQAYSHVQQGTNFSRAGLTFNEVETIEEADRCIGIGNGDRVTNIDDGTGDECDPDGNAQACMDIYRFSSDAHHSCFNYNNEITRINGSRTGADGTNNDDTLDSNTIERYGGNGTAFENTGLSGNAEEAVGIDSEWSSVYITAQDPWCRSCDACLSQVAPFSAGSPDKYLMMGIPSPRSGTK